MRHILCTRRDEVQHGLHGGGTLMQCRQSCWITACIDELKPAYIGREHELQCRLAATQQSGSALGKKTALMTSKLYVQVLLDRGPLSGNCALCSRTVHANKRQSGCLSTCGEATRRSHQGCQGTPCPPRRLEPCRPPSRPSSSARELSAPVKSDARAPPAAFHQTCICVRGRKVAE